MHFNVFPWRLRSTAYASYLLCPLAITASSFDSIITKSEKNATLDFMRGSNGGACEQKEGNGSSIEYRLPSFLVWRISWRMVVCIYYITAAGNSMSSQLGSSCPGKQDGTEKTGGTAHPSRTKSHLPGHPSASALIACEKILQGVHRRCQPLVQGHTEQHLHHGRDNSVPVLPGPGFFAVVWFGSYLPPPVSKLDLRHTGRLRETNCWRERGLGGGGGAKSYVSMFITMRQVELAAARHLLSSVLA